MIKESKKWLSSFKKDSINLIEECFTSSFNRSTIESTYTKDNYIFEQEKFFFSQITINDLIHLKNYIVFALSSLTKHLIDVKLLKPTVIIDSCKDHHGKSYKGIEILSPNSNRIKKYDNILIVSNHKISIYKYIKNNDILKSKK